jgi:hypothetical protein
MKDFKFFQKGTVDMMEVDETFITASFNDDTPEGVMGRRRLYHTNRDLYDRLRQSNNEMEQRDLNDNPIRLFQTTTTVTVKPTFWNEIKIFFNKFWDRDPTSTIVMIASLIGFLFFGIVKLLGL